MNITPNDAKTFESRYIFVAVVLTYIFIFAMLFVVYSVPTFSHTTLKGSQSSFWPTHYQTSAMSNNNVELLANYRLQKSQSMSGDAQMRQLTLASSDRVLNMETTKRSYTWRDRLADTVSNTEESLKTIINIIDFSAFIHSSQSALSLVSEPAEDIYFAHMSATTENNTYTLDSSVREKWLSEYYRLKTYNFTDLR